MKEKKFPAAALLKSNEFLGYQPDFAKVVLGDRDYTKAEAHKALEKFYVENPQSAKPTAPFAKRAEMPCGAKKGRE